MNKKEGIEEVEEVKEGKEVKEVENLAEKQTVSDPGTRGS